MIWIKSVLAGILIMIVGGIATLVAFAIYLSHKMYGNNATVGFDAFLLLSPEAYVLYAAWFLVGAGITYLVLRRQ